MKQRAPFCAIRLIKLELLIFTMHPKYVKYS